MYDLKDKTKEMASYILGMKYNQFIDMDYDEESEYLDNTSEKKPVFAVEEDERIIGRGSPFLARGEFLTMDEVDKEL